MKSKRYNLFQKLISAVLIFLHLFCFGPIRDALAFSAQSANYKLKSGTPTINGEALPAPYTKLLLHNDGADSSTVFTDASGSHVITNNGVPDANTKLLLHCNGIDGAANFTDETGKAVTVSGNVQIDTAQSKFGTSSTLFDGSGDYLSALDSDDWNFGAGDFTIDFWVKFNSLATRQSLINQWNDNVNNGWQIDWTTSNNILFRYSTTPTGQTDIIFGPWLPSANTWYHLAVVRNGDNLYAFVNGAQIGSTANLAGVAINNSTASLRIGVRYSSIGPTSDLFFDGWIDELRVSKGAARWISNFTPPASEYSLNNQVVTSSAQSKFGGSSAYFNNSYLTLADSADWDFGNGDWTIDLWLYLTNVATEQVFYAQNDISTSARCYLRIQNGEFSLKIDNASVVCDLTTSNSGVSANAWTHLAVVRSGNNFTIFVNGVNRGSTTGSGAFPDCSNYFYIGAAYSTAAGGNAKFFNGYLDEFRVCKGIARWTTDFTPFTQPYTIDDSDRPSVVQKTWLDALGEPAIGKCQSQSYVLDAGFIPTIIQSDPPVQIQTILNFTWQEGTSNANAFDLDDYFLNPVGFSYAVRGNVNITVSIDPVTHIVSFSQNAGWFGTEKIKFTATDSEYNSTTTNEVTLQVNGMDNPPVLDYIPDINAQETDLVKITPNTTDLDGDTL